VDHVLLTISLVRHGHERDPVPGRHGRGLAAGLGAIAGVFFSIAALQTDQRYLMYLSAALVGACLGSCRTTSVRPRPRSSWVKRGHVHRFTLAGLP